MPMENPLSERAGQKLVNKGAKKDMTITAIIQKMKRNAHNNLKNKFLRVVIEVEAALWLLIALALIIKTLR